MADKFSGLYDLHNHLVFGIDDGAKNSAETRAMLKQAADNRIALIAVTPHGLPQAHWDRFEENFAVSEAIAGEFGIKLIRGMEYNARNFPEDMPLQSLGGLENGLVLMDFRVPALPPEFQLCIDRVFNSGHTLVIAHPERTFPAECMDQLALLADNGVIYQVTAGSLLGKFGSSERKMAWKLLENGWARLIASDAHDVLSRSNCLLEAYLQIARRWGDDAAMTLQENARRAVEEPGAVLQKLKIKRRWFNFFR